MSVLKFHSKLYSLVALEEAAKAYDAIAGVRIESGSLYHQVDLRPKGSDFGGTRDELEKDFSNHALALMCAARGPR